MTDNEIKEVKSLRWLAFNFPRIEAPKDDVDRLSNCINIYCTNAANLINRLQAENERLNEVKNTMSAYIKGNGWGLISFVEFVKNAKAEAVTEFAERLKAEYADFDKELEVILPENLNTTIDDLLKEMVGEDNG